MKGISQNLTLLNLKGRLSPQFQLRKVTLGSRAVLPNSVKKSDLPPFWNSRKLGTKDNACLWHFSFGKSSVNHHPPYTQTPNNWQLYNTTHPLKSPHKLRAGTKEKGNCPHSILTTLVWTSRSPQFLKCRLSLPLNTQSASDAFFFYQCLISLTDGPRVLWANLPGRLSCVPGPYFAIYYRSNQDHTNSSSIRQKGTGLGKRRE